MFGKKFSSNIRRRKRMMISTIILLVVFLGIGYAAFTTDLSIGGTLNVSKYDHTLYGVLEKAAKKGVYAKEYTGEHQDSMAGVGTEKIYHWYAPSSYANGDALATEIIDKNNVIFADHCWQMIRTTDTGGVKIIYKGEPEDGKCLNTRGNHVGYASRTTQYMSTAYYYGTSYTYDKANNVFSLDGTITTGTIQPGQYTCKKTTSTGTCATLYLVDTLSSDTTYYVLPLSGNSNYSQFGTLQFNHDYNSPAYVGYMYNTIYSENSEYQRYYIQEGNVTINSNWYYSDVIDYTVSNQYTLINPQLISSLDDYSELVGRYVINTGNTSATTVLYVISANGDSIIYRKLIGGDLNITMQVGDSYTDNGNGTYTINSPTEVAYTNWSSVYSSNSNKYVCDGATATCSNLKHIVSSGRELYNYWGTENKYKYSESISYNDGIYTLTGDIKEVWDVAVEEEQSILSTHHYTCFSTGTTCSTVNYITYYSYPSLYYFKLTDGVNISTALNNMVSSDNVNQLNSSAKTGIDAWYKKHMINYTSQLEDVIYCNDRSITDLGSWNPNGGKIKKALQFKNYNSNFDLSCTNMTDKFSLTNAKAQLTYPVGLLTYPEAGLLGNLIISCSDVSYWLMSPTYFGYIYASERHAYRAPYYNYNYVNNSTGVRPAISLKPGTEYVSGTGSMADPYVVEVPMGTLTINYSSETGATLHEPYVETMPVGTSYSIPSPTIPGYITPQTLVTGTMSKHGRTTTVTYVEDSDIPPGSVGPGTDA